VDISKVVTLCKLLESLLLVSKGVDLNADAAKLNPIICSTFVFCYLWSIGGNIVDTHWDAFDSFVRHQFEDTPDAKVFPIATRTMQPVATRRQSPYAHKPAVVQLLFKLLLIYGFKFRSAFLY